MALSRMAEQAAKNSMLHLILGVA